MQLVRQAVTMQNNLNFILKTRYTFKKGSDRIILEISQASFGSCWGEGLACRALPVRG